MFDDRFTKSPDAVIDYSKLRASPDTRFSSELPEHFRQLDEFISSGKRAKVLDATAHVGGFTLNWATVHPRDRVTAVEIDAGVVSNLKYNVRQCRLEKRVTVVHMDIVRFISTTTDKFDFVFLDPPWGGPNYKHKYSMNLFLSGIAASKIIDVIFSRGISNTVFLKAPTNFNLRDIIYGYTAKTIMNPRGHKPDYIILRIENKTKKKRKV